MKNRFENIMNAFESMCESELTDLFLNVVRENESAILENNALLQKLKNVQ